MKIWLGIVALLLWIGLLALIFWFFTTQAFGMEYGGGIWWFVVVVIAALGLFIIWIAVDHKGHWRTRLLFLTAVAGLTGVSIWLGLKHQPFLLENINFKLGALLGLDTYQEIEYWNLPDAKSEVSYRSIIPMAQDQGYCGNCWAMASASMMSTRINKQKKDAGQSLPSTKQTSCLSSRTDLKWWYASPQFLTEADIIDNTIGGGKCDAGLLYQGLKLASEHKVPTGKCVPLWVEDSPSCRYGGQCPSGPRGGFSPLSGQKFCLEEDRDSYIYPNCDGGNTVSASNIRKVSGEEAMKKEISANGPIICILEFYEKSNGAKPAWTLSSADGRYANYTSDGFVSKPSMDGSEYQSAKRTGLHQVTVYGYGKAGDGTPYWDILNSWGDKWGHEGSSKVERGIDAWRIEEQCYTAEIKLN